MQVLSCRLSIGEPPERRILTHYDYSELAYNEINPDDYPSISSAYTGPILTAIREKQPVRVTAIPWGAPERRGLAHYACSERL